LEAIKLPYRITDIKNNSFDENQENQHNYLLQTSSCKIKKIRKNGFFFYKFHPNVSWKCFLSSLQKPIINSREVRIAYVTGNQL